MGIHAYNSEQALELLIKKLTDADATLADVVQAAIDAGKDVSEVEPTTNRRKKARRYRKTVPFSREEALRIALDALQAYFIEQPLFAGAAADSFAEAAIGVPPQRVYSYRVVGDAGSLTLEGKGVDKDVEFEEQTETQLSRTGVETIPLKRTSQEQINEQRHHVAILRDMIDFSAD